MQSVSLARVAVTVVATRGDEVHVLSGKLPRAEAIAAAQKEYPYPDATTFIVIWREVDVTKPAQSAKEIDTAVKQMKGLIFK